jgi:enoyl-CoA hydratase/carnithine racemase
MSLGLDRQSFKSNLSVSRCDDILTINLGGDDHERNTPFNVMDDMLVALDTLDLDPSIRLLVLSFTHGGYDFGTDVLDLSNLLPNEAERFSKLATSVYQRIGNLEIPTLCAIRGDCFGIGFEISLQCDLRVSCAGARFGLTGMNFGLTPNGLALRNLCSLVGESHARMMGLTGAMISADRGFVMGFVTNVLEDADFDSGVNVLSNHLAGMSRIAISETKKLLNYAVLGEAEHIMDCSAKALARCIEEDGETAKLKLFELDPRNATVH